MVTNPLNNNAHQHRVEYVPPTLEQTLNPRTAWRSFSATYNSQEKDDAWQRTNEIVKTYTDEAIARWNTEIDTLLVFAGLFSAILTAFNVESYQLLQPPPPDPTLAVLQQISAQLGSFSVGAAFVNSTQPAFAPTDSSDASPPAATSAIALNILWFSSLVFSLAAASIGIMVKQWFHEFRTGLSGASPEIARLRQYRLNSLQKWRVAEIVAILPVLLQIALILFLAGLLVLLWTLNDTVAIAISVLIGIVLAFIFISTLIPLIAKDCCYLSPPTYLLFRVIDNLRYRLRTCLQYCLGDLHLNVFQSSPPSTRISTFLLTFLGGIPLPPQTWRGRELRTVSEASEELDGDQIVTAYAATLDSHYLYATAAPNLTDLSSSTTTEVFEHVHALNIMHHGPYNAYIAAARASADFWLTVLLSAHSDPDHPVVLPPDRLRSLKRYISLSISRRPAVDGSIPRHVIALSMATVYCDSEYWHDDLYTAWRWMISTPPSQMHPDTSYAMNYVREAMDHTLSLWRRKTEAHVDPRLSTIEHLAHVTSMLVHTFLRPPRTPTWTRTTREDDRLRASTKDALSRFADALQDPPLSNQDCDAVTVWYELEDIINVMKNAPRHKEVAGRDFINAVETWTTAARHHLVVNPSSTRPGFSLLDLEIMLSSLYDLLPAPGSSAQDQDPGPSDLDMGLIR